MSTEPIESLISKIMNQYYSKPEGKSVLIGQKGNVLKSFFYLRFMIFSAAILMSLPLTVLLPACIA